MKRAQKGVTMLVVLVLMTVMLLGGLALARMTEVGTLASGNAAFREASLQASEVGVNTAFAAIQGLVDENTDSGGWYFASTQAQDAAGVPTVDFDAAPEVALGAYSVRYVVDRVCTGATLVADGTAIEGRHMTHIRTELGYLHAPYPAKMTLVLRNGRWLCGQLEAEARNADLVLFDQRHAQIDTADNRPTGG